MHVSKYCRYFPVENILPCDIILLARVPYLSCNYKLCNFLLHRTTKIMKNNHRYHILQKNVSNIINFLLYPSLENIASRMHAYCM